MAMNIDTWQNVDPAKRLETIDRVFREPLFLNPDGVRTRFPIGYYGLGRFEPGSLIVYNKKTGEPIPKDQYEEEDNGVFYNFKTPLPVGSYKDYEVEFVVKEDDLTLSYGTNPNYPGEEYFLFPNWIEAKGCGDAFWVGSYPAARSNASTSSMGSDGASIYLVTKYNVCTCTNITVNAMDTMISRRGGEFHRMRNREWANIVYWCEHMGFDVAGNVRGANQKGVNCDWRGWDITSSSDYDSTKKSGTTLLYCNRPGHAPYSWFHNFEDSVTGPREGYGWGICDLVGNIIEMVDGIKSINGQIYVFNDDNTDYVDAGINVTDLFLNASGTPNDTGCIYSPTNSELWKELIPTTNPDLPSLKLEKINSENNIYYNETGELALARGGYNSIDLNPGLCYFDMDFNTTTSKDIRVGCRLVKDL